MRWAQYFYDLSTEAGRNWADLLHAQKFIVSLCHYRPLLPPSSLSQRLFLSHLPLLSYALPQTEFQTPSQEVDNMNFRLDLTAQGGGMMDLLNVPSVTQLRHDGRQAQVPRAWLQPMVESLPHAQPSVQKLPRSVAADIIFAMIRLTRIMIDWIRLQQPHGMNGSSIPLLLVSGFISGCFITSERRWPGWILYFCSLFLSCLYSSFSVLLPRSPIDSVAYCLL